MPDITMCLNDDCPLRESCWRYKAKPKDQLQSYDRFEPQYGECEHYRPMRSCDQDCLEIPKFLRRGDD